MRRKAPKNEPEKKPAALDAAGFDRLEASLNELSKAAATQSLTYLLLWLYLFFTVTAVTDYDLLIENPIKLPIFNLEIGLLKFFIAAPPLFWLVQLYMVRKLAVIAEAVGEYLAAARQQAESAGADAMAVLERLRHRADGFVITRLLTRFDDIVLPDGRHGPAASELATALTVLAAGATLVVAPLLLYFGFQIRFLAYQSEGITWWHRIVVFFGLMLCVAAGGIAKLSWRDSFDALSTLRRHLFRFGGPRWSPGRVGLKKWPAIAKPVPLSVFLSVAIFTFPGEFASDGIVVENRPLGDWLAAPVVHRTLNPKVPFDREAVAKALGDGTQPGKLDEAGPPPLDLRHRDFSGRSLRGINLAGAWLQGVKLQEVHLQDADLESTQLQGAYLGYVRLQGADLESAQLQGAYLGYVRLQGANLDSAQLQGANFGNAHLQGAHLMNTQLQGARLSYTQFQGAYLGYVQLQGADLTGVQFQGAYLGEGELQGADLWGAELYGANLNSIELWRAGMLGEQNDYISLARRGGGGRWDQPESPEEFRPLVTKWLNQIPQGARRTDAEGRLRRLTEEGNPNDDRLKMQKIQGWLQAASDQSSPQARALYLADLACPHPDGKYMLPHMIYRSDDRNDVSAAALFDRLKDAARCPAAKELSAGHWNSLARNVEREKAAVKKPQ